MRGRLDNHVHYCVVGYIYHPVIFIWHFAKRILKL